ncbi:MAG TPA: FliM/FliN family flagellar motor C-terminal domain-containing protein [Candidatus Sulfotelmatobacter sp.]
MSAALSLGQTAPVVSANAEGIAQQREEEEKRWHPLLNLPCQLTVDLELPGFKVSDLLQLRTGSVLGSSSPVREDVPLRVNGTLIGWSEFEVVGEKLAVRLTELA